MKQGAVDISDRSIVCLSFKEMMMEMLIFLRDKKI